jgi:hypothetical protein
MITTAATTKTTPISTTTINVMVSELYISL